LPSRAFKYAGQGRDQRLAFAGLHLGDLALRAALGSPPVVQHGAADDLHVEVPHVEHTPPGLANDSEHLGQQVVERFAIGESLTEFDRLGSELFV
jgi:hypothetical protein